MKDQKKVITSVWQRILNKLVKHTSLWQRIITISGFFGFIITIWMTWHSFDKTLETTKDALEFSKEVQVINLMRDLSNEFDSNENFKLLGGCIEDCKVLYNNGEGNFSDRELRAYLNFFDDVGYYYERGVLDYKAVDHLFGSVITVAFVYKEIRNYIHTVRTEGRQEKAFVHFENLAKKISDDPLYKAEIDAYKRDCTSEPICAVPKITHEESKDRDR